MQTIDSKNLALVSQLFIKNCLTVAVAESCTSGMIQFTLSQAPDAMSFFQGGITVYNAGQKVRHLDINPIMAEACDSVSREIAEQMSLAAAGKFNAEAGIAITGYAQPVPEHGVKGCYAYIAVSKKGKIIVSKRIKGEAEKSLSENQQLFTQKIIAEVLKVLK